MDRRDFLLLRVAGPRETELSCERLYMRYVDAEGNRTTRDLLVLLQVERILSDFAAAGGAVRYDSQ
jgi:hypothetical protein